MKIYGNIKDSDNNNIRIVFENAELQHSDINVDTSDNVRFGTDITVSCIPEDTFEHILKTTAKIKLVTKIYLGDYLFANNATSVKVNIWKNNVCIFAGFVTPKSYSQNYAHDWEELEINCIDYLSILQYKSLLDNGLTYDELKAQSSVHDFLWYLSQMGFENLHLNIDDNTAISKLLYDKSKSYNDGTQNENIFTQLAVSENLVLDETEDDLWLLEDILLSMMMYLNLHIIQQGFDFYIFDWDSVKTKQSIDWYDIYADDDDNTSTISTTAILADDYSSDNTNITIADVYNQIQVKDNLEEAKEVLLSPFDDDSLVSLSIPSKYCTEYGGEDMTAFRALLGLDTTNYGDNAYFRDYYLQVKKNSNWSFKKDGVDNYDVIPKDANGNYYDAWKLPQFILNNPFASGILSFGQTDKVTKINQANIQNITSDTNYICIAVNGSGVDDKSELIPPILPGGDPMDPAWQSLPPIYPTDSDLENSNMSIKYEYGVSGQYSPSDSNVTYYLLFNGKILMLPKQTYSGPTGYFIPSIGYLALSEHDYYNHALAERKDKSGTVLYDYAIKARSANTYNDCVTKFTDPDEIDERRQVPYEGGDNWQLYIQKFYNQSYPTDTPTPNQNMLNLSPPIKNGPFYKRFYYGVGVKSYQQQDIIPFVDVLACQIQIGDKFCVESKVVDPNYPGVYKKQFEWVDKSQLSYTTLNDGTIRYDAFIYLAINIDSGQYLIGDEHSIYNNVVPEMNIDSGMAIPITAADNLSGELKFTIVGPVNTTWDNGFRRHPTWFRHTKLTPSEVQILPHIENIWISDFKMDLVSDNGKQAPGGDNDLIYRSDEQFTFINKKDDIDFNFTTTLTADEAAAAGVQIAMHLSDIISTAEGKGILTIINNITNENDKPEKHYVDAYYREYSVVKMLVNTDLHSSSNPNQFMFNRYGISYLNKNFYPIGIEQDVVNNTSNITFKEI